MNSQNNKPFLVATNSRLGLEAWAQYEADSDVYTVAASSDMDDPIGEASSKSECNLVARNWFQEKLAEAAS